MTVLIHGVPPKLRVWVATCPTCKSVLMARDSDPDLKPFPPSVKHEPSDPEKQGPCSVCGLKMIPFYGSDNPRIQALVQGMTPPKQREFRNWVKLLSKKEEPMEDEL